MKVIPEFDFDKFKINFPISDPYIIQEFCYKGKYAVSATAFLVQYIYIYNI